VVVASFTFMIPLPNLFLFFEPFAQLTLFRSKGWWKQTKLNRASHRVLAKDYGPPSTTTTHLLSQLRCERETHRILKLPFVSQKGKDNFYEFYGNGAQGLFLLEQLAESVLDLKLPLIILSKELTVLDSPYAHASLDSADVSWYFDFTVRIPERKGED
jgi:hypothetical protein